jgi:hypothetical protein
MDSEKKQKIPVITKRGRLISVTITSEKLAQAVRLLNESNDELILNYQLDNPAYGQIALAINNAKIAHAMITDLMKRVK